MWTSAGRMEHSRVLTAGFAGTTRTEVYYRRGNRELLTAYEADEDGHVCGSGRLQREAMLIVVQKLVVVVGDEQRGGRPSTGAIELAECSPDCSLYSLKSKSTSP
ncbi:hypothetical protein TRIUR3_16641 [Triticum urartu]|uniref:Uncharacterized protein n=1 Tax=Triticum urartu TaxID=4572 RepID=M7ZKD1_TRIUA|nr:hypothetical protein TRIUR3_16641 [Triticum urartu]